MGNYSYLACRFMWRTGLVRACRFRSGHFAPSVCYGWQISAWGCCEKVGTCDRPPAEFSNCASRAVRSGAARPSCRNLHLQPEVAAWKCPANVPVAPIFTRACVLGTQSCRWRCAPCCGRPRWLYASRYCELKRLVGSPGRCSRAAKGRFLGQFEYLNGCNGCFAVSFGQMGVLAQSSERPNKNTKAPSKQNERPNKNTNARPNKTSHERNALKSTAPSRHGRTRAPQPRRRRRAQLPERHSAILPRRVGRRTAAFGRQSCGTEGARLLIQDLAAAARQVSAARPMRAGVLSSDRAPSPGWDRDARRKVPSRADGERSVALRSLSDRAARRRACADARASVPSPAPPQAANSPSWR